MDGLALFVGLVAYTPMLKKMHTDAIALFEELRASLERPLA